MLMPTPPPLDPHKPRARMVPSTRRLPAVIRTRPPPRAVAPAYKSRGQFCCPMVDTSLYEPYTSFETPTCPSYPRPPWLGNRTQLLPYVGLPREYVLRWSTLIVPPLSTVTRPVTMSCTVRDVVDVTACVIEPPDRTMAVLFTRIKLLTVSVPPLITSNAWTVPPPFTVSVDATCTRPATCIAEGTVREPDVCT